MPIRRPQRGFAEPVVQVLQLLLVAAAGHHALEEAALAVGRQEPPRFETM
jgi:hypothetical protein